MNFFRSIQRYLQLNNPEFEKETKKALRSEKCRDIMYHNMKDDDVFSKEFNEALEPVKSFLKPHLHK